MKGTPETTMKHTETKKESPLGFISTFNTNTYKSNEDETKTSLSVIIVSKHDFFQFLPLSLLRLTFEQKNEKGT